MRVQKAHHRKLASTGLILLETGQGAAMVDLVQEVAVQVAVQLL